MSSQLVGGESACIFVHVEKSFDLKQSNVKQDSDREGGMGFKIGIVIEKEGWGSR